MRIFIGENGHVLITRMEPIINKMGHSFIRNNPSKCDVHLAFIRLENKINLPTIVRIDGIYYDLAKDYKGKNIGISEAHSKCEGIIYQSESSKKMCEKYLTPRKKNSITKVIYNGIEKIWAGNFKEHDGINILISAKWRRHKRLKEIIDLFMAFLKLNPDSTLHILGKLHENKEVKHKRVKYYGMIPHSQMTDVMQNSDLSLHLSKRDSCPNSVVECLAMGIPIVTTESCGGATEMCMLSSGCIVCTGDKDNTEPGYPYSDEWNIIKPELFNSILLSMDQILKNKTRSSFPDKLTIEYCCEEYVKILRKVI